MFEYALLIHEIIIIKILKRFLKCRIHSTPVVALKKRQLYLHPSRTAVGRCTCVVKRVSLGLSKILLICISYTLLTPDRLVPPSILLITNCFSLFCQALFFSLFVKFSIDFAFCCEDLFDFEMFFKVLGNLKPVCIRCYCQ